MKEILDDWLFYDAETGILRWKKSSGSARAGDIAGKPSLSGKKLYVKFRIIGRTVYAHRVIAFMFLGLEDHMQVDHINGNSTDNRLCNLRVVDDQINNMNLRMQKRNKLGITGVKITRSGSYHARIEFKNQHIMLGTHKTIFDAACARKSAELRYGFHERHGVKQVTERT